MGTARGQIDLFGNVDGDAIGIAARHYLPLPLIYKDFWVLGRDLETGRQFGLPLDTGKAAAAAAACAQAEDHLLVAGDLSLELPGLRTVEGHQTQAMSDWEQEGRAFADVVATYSPIWQFNYMAVPRDYHSNTLRSEGDCLASGYPIQRSQVFEN